MDDDDEGINCHQRCSGLEMNQMMQATNLGGSEVVNKNIQRWMEAQLARARSSGNPQTLINMRKLCMILPQQFDYHTIMLTPYTSTSQLDNYIVFIKRAAKI